MRAPQTDRRHVRRPVSQAVILALMLALMLASAGPAWSIDDRADVEPSESVSTAKPVAWKLSLGAYRENASPDGHDVNLRGNTERQTFWVGHYRSSHFDQTRVGLEHQQPVAWGKLLVSGQVASHGFAGGSVTWEAPLGAEGAPYALIGVGRTNTRPYVNLNFDPNDSVLVGGGWRIDAAQQWIVYHVWDDRLDTDQRVTHLVYRRSWDEYRFTIDLFERRGRPEPGEPMRRGGGLSLGVDVGRWFARIARDAAVSYGPTDMTRVTLGMRF